LPETALTAAPNPAGTPQEASADPGTRPDQVTAPLRPETADLPAQVGPYRIEGEVGRGGMGVVLRAHDDTFHRSLAVKVLLADPGERPEQVQRFLEEAQVMGQLQHPGIAPIHRLGWLPDGRPYFSMKLIQGRTLADLLRERADAADDLPRFLGLFAQVCQTVAYAHSRGILHRDLKPPNIMVGAFGEVQVMDWGLAKVLARGGEPEAGVLGTPYSVLGTGDRICSTSREQTQAGSVLGTPAYMAPEQARGELEKLDERCDVFGLGAILCEILTRKPPFIGKSAMDSLYQAALGDLGSVYSRLDGCGADPQLVGLARKCLAPEPADRLRHASELAQAVEAHQAQVQERLRQAELERSQALLKAAEERKRRRLVLALAAAVVLLLAVGGAAALWVQHQQAERARAQATRLAQAEAEVRLALKEAATLGERALTLIDNPTSWQTTLEAALAAIGRAQAVLGREPELARGALADQVGRLQEALEADEKDRVLLTGYDQALLSQSEFDAPRRSLKVRESYPQLKEALARYGLPLGGVSVAAAVTRIRQRPQPIQVQLLGVLQECLRLAPPDEGKSGQWLKGVLAADPDPWRQRARRAVEDRNWSALQTLLETMEATQHPPTFLVGLAQALPDSTMRSSQIQLLRRAQEHYPADFWVNVNLAAALYRSGVPTSTVFLTDTARLTREELAAVSDAVGFYRAALILRPKTPMVHYNLGNALRARGDLPAAADAYRKALQFDDRLVEAHNNLGLVLYQQKRFARAEEAFAKAIALDGHYALAHNNLGMARQAQKKLAAATAAFLRASELDPRTALPLYNLGNVRFEQHNLEEAVAQYQQAIQRDPRFAPAHLNFGHVLYLQKKLKEAAEAYGKVLDLEPKHALACYYLGHVFREQGRFADALVQLKKGQALGAGQPDWPSNAAQHIELCQRLLALERRLPAIDKGVEKPRDAVEQLAFADFYARYKKRYAAAAHFYEGALTAKPSLSPELQAHHRYNAACAAALAAAGQGEDAGKLDAKEKTRLRQQALAWLGDNLQQYAKQFEAADAKTRQTVQQSLQHWQKDPELASVRGQEALAKVPEAERAAWQQLWADVEKQLKRARP
jgi:serine/threonine-protein kinase